MSKSKSEPVSQDTADGNCVKQAAAPPAANTTHTHSQPGREARNERESTPQISDRKFLKNFISRKVRFTWNMVKLLLQFRLFKIQRLSSDLLSIRKLS